MEIRYNVTGAKRKELVKVISDTTGARAEYKFMPTCNYEIDYFTAVSYTHLVAIRLKNSPNIITFPTCLRCWFLIHGSRNH